MNIAQIFTKPITMPDYPNPAEARRYIDDPDGFYGYDYLFLEDATWNALHHIASDRDCTVDDLCATIESHFAPGEPFAPAARAYVLHHIAEHIPADSELPSALQNFLCSLGARRSVQ
jgi:predicted DNA-binding ribbon-helix-helix protein